MKDGFDPNKLLYGREAFALIFIMQNHHKYYHKDLAKALIDNGANVDLCTKTPTSSLYYAVSAWDKEGVKDLLDLDANPNLMPGHDAPLHLLIRHFNNTMAIPHPRIEVLDLLLNHPNIDLIIKDKDGHEPLYYAYYDQFGHRYPSPITEVVDKFRQKGITFIP